MQLEVEKRQEGREGREDVREGDEDEDEIEKTQKS